MGYLRWCLTLVALVLAAVKGKGPLYRWLRGLSTSLDASLARARVEVARDPDARLAALDEEARESVRGEPFYGGPTGGPAMYFEEVARDPVVHAREQAALIRRRDRRA